MFTTISALDVWQAFLAAEYLQVVLFAIWGLPAMTHGIACRLFSRRNMWDGGRCSHSTASGFAREWSN